MSSFCDFLERSFPHMDISCHHSVIFQRDLSLKWIYHVIFYEFFPQMYMWNTLLPHLHSLHMREIHIWTCMLKHCCRIFIHCIREKFIHAILHQFHVLVTNTPNTTPTSNATKTVEPTTNCLLLLHFSFLRLSPTELANSDANAKCVLYSVLAR